MYREEVLSEYRPVQVRGAERPLPAAVPFADSHARIATYGDAAAGAALTPGAAGDAMRLTVRSGHGWGCGLSVAPNQGQARADGSVSALGARRLVIRMKAPAGVNIQATLNESGHGPTESQTFDGADGADGEAYVHPFRQTEEGWHEYAFDLLHFEPTPHYGNQRGNCTVDTQAIGQVGITFAGQPVEDVAVEIAWFRFE